MVNATKQELYKACKYEAVNFKADHGCNAAEMWALVNGRTKGWEHTANFWKDTCLDDYRNGRL